MRERLPGSLLLLAVAALLFFAVPLAALITDLWWFESLGFGSVFLTRLGVQTALFLTIGGGTALLVGLSGRHALAVTRNQPIHPDLLASPLGRFLARPDLSGPVYGLAAVLGFFAGMRATSWWATVLLFAHRSPFGFEDPALGLDASFYVFVLPLMQELRDALLGAVLLSGMVALGIHLARGGVRVQLFEERGELVAGGLSVPVPVRRHLGNIAAALLLLAAIGTWFRRFGLLYDQSGLVAGPGYADVHGTLPLLLLQSMITAVAAFVAWLGFERMRLGLVAGAGALVVLFASVTSLYPQLVQRFSVLPNELVREAPYIRSHVNATRIAWGLDDVEERSLSGELNLSWSDIEENAPTIQNVRLWDHAPLLDTFSQVQEIRTYYEFRDVDNDRYVVDGELRQIMLSPRELSHESLPRQAQTWVNERITYTHGYGVALGPVNEVTPEGLPRLFIQDLPPRGSVGGLEITRPEIYFGEAMSDWVLVGTDNPEFDYPAGDENRYGHHEGGAGVELGRTGRLLFALRFGSTELLFSSDIGPESRVLLHRRIADRVRRIAPFLQLDSDPYMIIHDGRLVWMIDAYTATSRFPYSRALSTQHPVNYLRNAVKITVDAYDGSTRFYLVDPSDPIARAWADALPALFVPASDMPEGLRAHLRYPQDLFAVQSRLFAIYHMQDHQIFYNREDEWEIPVLGSRRMEPYYTVMKLPDEAREEFILMLPFTPANKDNLAAWMVARSDGEHYGELRVYKFPKERMVYGPRMITARINQDDDISQKLSLWNQQGSDVLLGTLLVIPVEKSLIYVQPLYLRADDGSIPELKRVIVAYENRIAMEPTLEQGLRVLFGSPTPDAMARSGTSSERLAAAAERSRADAPEGEDWHALARQAQQAWEHALQAAQRGAWREHGEHLEQLEDALQALGRLAEPFTPTLPDDLTPALPEDPAAGPPDLP